MKMSVLDVFETRSDKTISRRFRTNSGSKCIRQTANHFFWRFDNDYFVMMSLNISFYVSTFYGVNLNVVCPLNSQFHLNGSWDDKWSYSVHLTVLHRFMCLFRRKLYQMPFADQITRNLDGVQSR